MFFQRAMPIWADGQDEKDRNVTCLFTLFAEKGDYVLRITACNFYRILVDGKFFAYGPARAAHGYARVDEYTVSIGESGAFLCIEAAGYRCNSFYALN